MCWHCRPIWGHVNSCTIYCIMKARKWGMWELIHVHVNVYTSAFTVSSWGQINTASLPFTWPWLNSHQADKTTNCDSIVTVVASGDNTQACFIVYANKFYRPQNQWSRVLMPYSYRQVPWVLWNAQGWLSTYTRYRQLYKVLCIEQ